MRPTRGLGREPLQRRIRRRGAPVVPICLRPEAVGGKGSRWDARLLVMSWTQSARRGRSNDGETPERGRGPDPYDALNATRLPRIARESPLALRVVTQAVKRSPVNLRPVLGIADGLSAATLAHVISAYARNGFLDEVEAQSKLRECINRLASLRCATFAEPCWGYHFDVQTRVFFYPRTTPNTIATAFAALALLDAYDLAGVGDGLDLAIGAGDFFLRHVPQTATAKGSYFGYLPGDSTPIHNANMLVAELLARLARAPAERISLVPPAPPRTTPSTTSDVTAPGCTENDRISCGSTGFTPDTYSTL